MVLWSVLKSRRHGSFLPEQQKWNRCPPEWQLNSLFMDKSKLKQLKQEVSRILFEIWDPIGVNDLADPTDDPETWADLRGEYRDYEDRILSSLLRGATE